MPVATSAFSKKALGLWLVGIILATLTVLLVVWAATRQTAARRFTLTRELDMTPLSQQQREEFVLMRLRLALDSDAQGIQVDWRVTDQSVEITGVADERTIRRLEAYLKVIELELPAIHVANYHLRRQTSDRKLQYLWRMLHAYAEEHDEAFPETLSMLGEYDTEGHLPWLVEHCAYPGRGKSLKDSLITPVAYDKSLLENGKGTNVLFLDRHVGYVKPDKLRELGITPKP